LILKMLRLPIFPALAFQIVLFSVLIRAAADSNLPSSIDSSAIVSSDSENLSNLSKIPQLQTDSSKILTISENMEMFNHLGDFHRLNGIYGVVTGIVGIFAGVVLLDKVDSTPLAISFFALGGISIGFGIWEMKIGGALSRYAAPVQSSTTAKGGGVIYAAGSRINQEGICALTNHPAPLPKGVVSESRK
jgi:hypothetical protein